MQHQLLDCAFKGIATTEYLAVTSDHLNALLTPDGIGVKMPAELYNCMMVSTQRSAFVAARPRDGICVGSGGAAARIGLELPEVAGEGGEILSWYSD